MSRLTTSAGLRLAFINSERELVLGEYYMCRVVEVKEYDVVVEVI